MVSIQVEMFLDLPYDLTPALTLESALVHVKTVPAGACMGYGATYQADSEQVIATVPIGYADGWTRDMQNFSVFGRWTILPNRWTSIYGPDYHSSA